MKRILLVLSAILITNTVFGQMPSSNLLAWYPFCADTTDHSGGGNDLIVTGTGTISPVLIPDRFGTINTAYDFNGINDLMRYSTFFSSSGDFSYSCWINANSSQSSTIIYNGNVSASGFGLVMNNGTIGSPGDTVSLLFGGMGLKISAPITLNQWHHLVFTRGGNIYELYVDTVLIGSILDYFYPLTSPDVFNVGYDYATSSNAFSGHIDDIAVYSKKISALEVSALYHFNPDILPFSLGNDTAICTNSLLLLPMPGTPGADYLWSTGNTSISVTVVPPAFPGTNYWLTISKLFGCTYSDTINVRHIFTTVNLGPRDTVVCQDSIVVLNTRVPGEIYLWSTGDTTASISVIAAGTYWLTVDSLGCFGSDTMTLHTNPHPLVDLGPDTVSCFGAVITLQSSIPYTAPTYKWEAIPILTAPATTPTVIAPITGKYWLTVRDGGGCPWADTVNVLIVTDTFSFLVRDTAICQGSSFATTVSNNPGINYQWRPTTGMVISNIPSPTIVTSVSATYVLTASYPGCPDILDSFHLDIQPNPLVLYFGPNRSVCIGDTVHISSHVSPASYPHYIYSWSPGVSLDDSTATTVVFTAGDTTNLVLTVSTPAGCSGKDSLVINVHPHIFASIASPPAMCPGDSVQLNVLITDPLTTATFQWIPGIYLSDPNSDTTWLRPTTSENYMIVGTSQYGCRDTMGISVSVRPAAVIYLEDSAVIYPGETYQISPQTNCTFFGWSPELGLDDTALSNPKATPASNTIYKVHGITQWGCTTTDSIRIRVSPATLIAMPNAFTPGADINSRFKVMKNGLAGLNYFRIYNRWGVLVYESNKIDDGWDGTYAGKPQPFGVYVYTVEAVTNTGRVFQKQGNVTLIR